MSNTDIHNEVYDVINGYAVLEQADKGCKTLSETAWKKLYDTVKCVASVTDLRQLLRPAEEEYVLSKCNDTTQVAHLRDAWSKGAYKKGMSVLPKAYQSSKSTIISALEAGVNIADPSLMKNGYVPKTALNKAKSSAKPSITALGDATRALAASYDKMYYSLSSVEQVGLLETFENHFGGYITLAGYTKK